jgi:hypothetical protein
MIRASELTAAAEYRLTTTVPVWRSENRTVSSWFDAGDAGRIVGEVSIASRGLSVEEHTTRILMHLLAEREVG